MISIPVIPAHLRQAMLAAALTALLLPTAAYAGTIEVDDPGDTVDPGTCTLRAAMQSAFQESNAGGCTGATASPNVITFSSDFTITVGTTLPFVANDVTVDGSGHVIVVDGDDDGNTPFVLNTAGGHLTLSNLAIQGSSSASGGAVRVAVSGASLTAVNVTFTGNSASSQGGAISSNGRLVLTNVIFEGNSATGSSAEGGAIHFSGAAASMTITNGVFINNSAERRGGAISVPSLGNPLASPPDPSDPSERFVLITNGLFSLNSADGSGAQDGGGAIFAHTDGNAFFNILGSQFLGNSADNGGGGAILLTLSSRMAFVSPDFPAVGGIYATNFFANTSGGSGADGIGGAIFSRGRLSVVSSSFIDNESTASSGGAIGHNASTSGDRRVIVANVTFAGNSAEVNGGAIAQLDTSGAADVINATFSGNSAVTGNGGAIFNNNGTVTVANSILANSPNGGNCGGTIVDAGGNLQFAPDSGCGVGIPAGDPDLAPPAVNPGANGLVLTMALQASSAALGAGVQATCDDGPILNFDARGLPTIRPLGDPACDSGAYESDLLAPAPGIELTPVAGLDFGLVETGATSGVLFATLTNTGNAEMSGIDVLTSGPFARNGGDCGATLAALSSCTIGVDFTPPVDGPHGGDLTVNADGGLSDSIPLSGEGFTPAAVIDLAPAAGLDFGLVETGTTSGVLFATLTNTGNGEMTGIDVLASGPFARNGGDCGVTLPASSSCTIGVDFTPPVDGPHSGDLTVTAAGGLSGSIPLAGEGFTPSPGIDLTPDAGLHFGAVETGTTSPAMVATLTNTGAAPLTGVAVSASGAHAADFGVDATDCGATLPVGESCTILVELTPSEDGPRTASLTASADGPLSDSISLTGEGFTPSGLDLAPPGGLDFGLVETGTTSPLLSATLTNSGSVQVTGIVVSTTGPFARNGGTCGATLGGSASCTLLVEFTPPVDGLHGGTLEVAADGGLMAAVPLTGEGFTPAAAMELSPAAGLDFGLVPTGTTSGNLTATLTNSGTATMTGIAVATSGPFAQSGGSCGVSLAAGLSCTVTAQCTPPADGPHGGNLTTTADGGLSDSIPLACEGFTPTGGFDLTPDGGLAFGFVVTGTTSPPLTATLTNTTGSGATGIVVATSGPFARNGGTCGATLGDGASCTVVVEFTPPSAGAHGGNLTVQADGGLFDAITLSGTGTAPLPGNPGFGSIPPPPGPLDFGNALLGIPRSLLLVIQETGDADLTVSNPVLAGPDAGDFTVEPVFPLTILDGGAGRSVELTCAPSVLGPLSATLSLNSDDPTQPTVIYDLTCNGVESTASIQEIPTATTWGLLLLALLLAAAGAVTLTRRV